MPVLVDTGILYAATDADDDWHARARDSIESTNEPLLVPVTVLPEIAYLLATRLDASVVAMTERLRLTALATTDRRHFAAVRPRHVATLELVP